MSSGSLFSPRQSPTYDTIDDVLEVLLNEFANESSSAEAASNTPLVPPEVENKNSRKEKNKILAKRSRNRNKFILESLQKEAARLVKENSLLKNVIQQRLDPMIASTIIPQHETKIPDIVGDALSTCFNKLSSQDATLMHSLADSQKRFCITNCYLPDNPIIYASQGFLDLTGYPLEQVIGRNCRFLQGPETDPATVRRLSEGIQHGEDVNVLIINYKANGEKFYNQLFVSPLRDENNVIINYVGVQCEIKPPEKDGGADSDNDDHESTSKPTKKRKTSKK